MGAIQGDPSTDHQTFKNLPAGFNMRIWEKEMDMQQALKSLMISFDPF
jgi:hypothetical protein